MQESHSTIINRSLSPRFTEPTPPPTIKTRRKGKKMRKIESSNKARVYSVRKIKTRRKSKWEFNQFKTSHNDINPFSQKSIYLNTTEIIPEENSTPPSMDGICTDFQKTTRLQNKRTRKPSMFPHKIKYFQCEINEDEDIKKLIDLPKKNRRYQYNIEEVNVSLYQYFETYILHILYFTIFGPLMIFYNFICCKHKWFMYNLKFFAPDHFFFYVQIINWVTTILVYYLTFYVKNSDVGDSTQVYMLIVVVAFRTSSIAAKYSTYSRNQMRMIREIKISNKNLYSELMLLGWTYQKDDIILKEIRCAARRLELDFSTFYIGFLDQNSTENLEKEIGKIYEKSINFYKNKQLEFSYSLKQGNKTIKYFNGVTILHLLINNYNKKKNYIFFPSQIFKLIGLIYGLSDGFIRVMYNQSFHGETILEIVVFYITTFNTGFMVYTFLEFFYRFFIDINRKAYLMEQIGQMLSPRCLRCLSDTKDVPTIDIICSESLHAWMNLRRLAADYGLKYLKRHELFLPSLLHVMLMSSLILLDIFALNNVSKRSPTSLMSVDKDEIEYLKLSIFCVYNNFFIFCLLITLLYTATRINSFSEGHNHIIKKNKVLLEDIKIYRNQYFEVYSTRARGSVSADGMIRNRDFRGPQSPLHGFLIEDISIRLDRRNIFEEAEKLDRRIDCQYEQLMENLSDDSQQNSFKLLGYDITVSSVNQLILFLISLALTLYEIFGI